MGWSGTLKASCAEGDSVTYTPDTATAHGYTASAFTAPKKGIYRLTLKGSGGQTGRNVDGRAAAGGTGGLTKGYLLLEKGQTVYVGCGGPCSAAWAASANPGNAGIAKISASKLYFAAGAGGGGGTTWGLNGWGPSGKGGNGGGSAGEDGGNTGSGKQGAGGTQSAGGKGYDVNNSAKNNGSYGSGAQGVYTNNDDGSSGGSGTGGDGGDGYYGGGAGGSGGSSFACGGGGGSGYVHAAKLTVGSRTYSSTTAQGGGAAANSAGSVTVTYDSPAELPIAFDGTRLTGLYYNGKAIDGLVYNGVRVFCGGLRGLKERMRRRFARKELVTG